MTHWLEEILQRVCASRVAVFGDFCLDAYWELDASAEELSVETGLPVRRVRRQRYSLGGAGNVAANLVALGAGAVRAVGLVGVDPFGGWMRQMLAELGVEVTGLLTGPADWQTPVYGKPLVGGVEQNRLDFGGCNAMDAGGTPSPRGAGVSPARAGSVPPARNGEDGLASSSDQLHDTHSAGETPAPRLSTMDALAAALDEAAGCCDAVILNQQILAGVSPPAMIGRINRVVERHEARRCRGEGRCVFLADSRDFGQWYRGVVLKTNAHEALRMLGRPRAVGERVGPSEAAAAAGELHARTGRPVFVTRGEFGLAVADGGAVREVPAVAVPGPIDPVGAGDTAVAAIAAVLASGGDVLTAAKLANLAASVTVRKLRTTGTASPAELLAEFGGLL